MYGLLGLAVVIALFSIANSMWAIVEALKDEGLKACYGSPSASWS